MISILPEPTKERHPSILGFGAWPSMEGEKEGGGIWELGISVFITLGSVG